MQYLTLPLLMLVATLGCRSTPAPAPITINLLTPVVTNTVYVTNWVRRVVSSPPNEPATRSTHAAPFNVVP
jgi:hypothetical protein